MTAATLRCDGCSEPNVEWAYPCDDFEITIGDTTHKSVGAWLVCDRCSTAIELDAVAPGMMIFSTRSLAMLLRHEGLDPNDTRAAFSDRGRELAKYVTQLHGGFYAARKGPAMRWG